jgi:hypoxanthine phosphoribosyltransferase
MYSKHVPTIGELKLWPLITTISGGGVVPGNICQLIHFLHVFRIFIQTSDRVNVAACWSFKTIKEKEREESLKRVTNVPVVDTNKKKN